MYRRLLCILVLTFTVAVFGFSQASALRDYVGSVSIGFHPDVESYMKKTRENMQKRGYTNSVKAIDNYLKGLRGSGFVFVDDQGKNYLLTNHHVIEQSNTLSVVFEKQDGTKTRYDELKVVMADEDKDIALLAFSGKPFTQGLAFNTTLVDDGDTVFAAGFPGLGGTIALWQFTQGTVSNAVARLPKNDEGETIGPYIQHTAQIDPGNSGGPLLAAAADVPTGYAVAGINTMSALFHQAANYAIPIADVQAFLNIALGKEPVNDRELLEKRVNAFVKGINVPRSVYGHIAEYLTSACTAANAEYAISELLDRGSKSQVENIDGIFGNSPVDGMSAAVGWLIENSMRPKSGYIKISLESINANNNDGYTVVFQVNGASVSSEWAKEWGIWRLDRFGDAVAGDKTLLAKKEDQKKQGENLRTEPNLYISAGFTYLLDPGMPAFNLSLKGWGGVTGWALRLISTGGDFTAFDFAGGIYIPIRAGGIAFVPYGELGLSFAFGDKVFSLMGPDMGIVFEGGLKFTTAAVPGLYFQAGYHYNLSIWDAIFGSAVNDSYNPYSPDYDSYAEYIKARNYWGHYNSFLMFAVGYAF
ncbi:hypothetical protein AGMMS49928_27000 [Spirochaetia bacterium]|nr:hypothetical protein AGMMS49928_27000 [Spirochaetia bacterium]